jgi:hypothetical protein
MTCEYPLVVLKILLHNLLNMSKDNTRHKKMSVLLYQTLRACFHGRLELEMKIQLPPQCALFEKQNYMNCRPNWRSFSCQPIMCKHGNKIFFFFIMPTPLP